MGSHKLDNEERIASPLVVLLDLNRRARRATSDDELAFLAVNDSRALAVYRQAALWFSEGGVRALSGILQTEMNAPYVHWLERVCQHLQAQMGAEATPVSVAALPTTEALEWSEWLPPYGLWVPLNTAAKQGPAAGGLLFAADAPWTEAQVALLREWLDAWQYAWVARAAPPHWSWQRIRRAAIGCFAAPADRPWWRRPRILVLAGVLAVLLFPVRLTVLAPGELVPAHPAIIRAPLDGVIAQFHVAPNELVKAGQPLFGFDEAPLAARRDVSAQALLTAEAEYRQFAHQAVTDNKSKAQLAQLLGKIEERKAEAGYLSEQLGRARVTSPVDGLALFDDPTEWIGKPVQTGERVLRVAAAGDVEVEAWVAMGDAITLDDDASVTLYLAANPLSSLTAHLRYLSHDAVARPNGLYAYRLRAKLAEGTDQRVGLKGTVKIHGHWVALGYWMVRRPLASLRQTLGV